MMPFPACASNQKIVRLALKMAIVARKKQPGIVQRARMFCSLSIFVIASATGLVRPVMAQEEPLTEQGYEREELGVNPYTAPSIARIFQQLADGFLVVEVERRNAVDNLVRVLSHSVSLTELGLRVD